VILLLHTSAEVAHIGLAEENRVVVEESFPVDRQFAAVLAPRLRDVLARHGYTTWSAVEGIVVYAGPEGFTSLRVGVATANALALALGVPVLGVTGDIRGLKDLWEGARHALPPPGGVVLPRYAGPPKLGPVPARGKE